MLYMSFMKTEPHSPNKHTTMPKSCFLVSMMKLFLFRVFLLSFIHTISPSLAITNITTDQSALLALKAHITHDPQNLLATNWSTSTSVCNWVGVTCGLRHQRVTVLNVSHFGFTGTIPPHLGNLSFLTELRIRNDSFYGSLPIELTHLRRIKFIDFKYNNFTGEIPSWLGSFSKLQYLHLGCNQFSGTIPKEIGNATMLKILHLYKNHLSGEFPQEIGNIELEVLQVYSNNLTGTIPSFIFNMSHLKQLALSHNYFPGMLPDNICHTLPNLEELYLKNCNLRGRIPSQLSQCGRLRIFNLATNNLTGKIPSQICNASLLQILVLSNNRLKGSLPPCLGNFSEDLSVLDLRNNRLQGLIPIFAKVKSLRSLNFNGNQLEGPLPQCLHTCKKLEVLDIGNNEINGPFPNRLESLPELKVLILGSNRFDGPVGNPTTRFPFQKLRIMDLSNNDFIGHLPRKYFESLSAMMESHAAELGYMGDDYYRDSVMVDMKAVSIELVKIQNIFRTIDLSRNLFVGEIPNSIGRLKSLHGLNFSHNKLSGSIPPSLRNLSNLEWLDLSSNELVGVIPGQLVDLTFLEFLNLSHNKLDGPIPRGKQFDTFDNDSFIGNLRLYGPPLSKACNNEQEQPPSQRNVQQAEDDGFDNWKVVWMGYCSGLVIGISIGYIVLSSGKFNHWFAQRFGGRTRFKRGRRRN